MKWQIRVANPSSYSRSDYVEVNLDKLEVPPNLGEKSLRLFRLEQGNSRREIPFQVDSILGQESQLRNS